MRSWMRSWRVLALAALPGFAFARIAFAADALNGEAIAKRKCAACHFVTRGENSPSAEVPPFVEIAARHPSVGELVAVLSGPHPRMPDLRLTRDEVDDLAAYLASLNPAPAWRPKP